ncbi:MAG: hypothetical protein DWQ44_00810 [Bacteroidetes bacterium]|nr:MAG: hypothetical protein DWQ33_00280 [Bacteroidota bacterium]REK05035.1 MAG: hypothetical protein DWQ39_07440 [Bacteroidota bacterium]REK36462.1 MAG: hypothetical protein DWQ44_00810 [Bacteroidota bacterium]REK51676.1 MAG: hypothetical protein DWQ48_00560 [Bacteroidota bacterium]
MKKQSYSNHKRSGLFFNGFFLSLIIITLIGSLINLNMALDRGGILYPSALLVATSILMLIMFHFLRTFSIRLQDRVIRSEENFRHYLITGKPLDSRIHIRQISSLRYAPDNELAELAKEAAERQLSPEEIKKLINRWRGDYHSI